MTSPSDTTRYFVVDAVTGKFLAMGPDGCRGMPRAASWSTFTRDRSQAVQYAVHSQAFTCWLRRRDDWPALIIEAIERTPRARPQREEHDDDVTVED